MVISISNNKTKEELPTKEDLEKERESILDDFEFKLEKIEKINRVLNDNVGDDLTAKFMDVTNDLERTNSPKLDFIFLHIYLRQGEKFFGEIGKKVLGPLIDWFTSGMIGYKDKRMEHLKEILKKAPENVQITHNTETKMNQTRDKIFKREKKEEL